MRRETSPSPCCRARHRDFNPLPPCGGRPSVTASVSLAWGFQSTPSVRRETTKTEETEVTKTEISIHSLRAEGDCINRVISQKVVEFQSTPSVRRETLLTVQLFSPMYDFNPLPPCGGRRQRLEQDNQGYDHFNPLPPCGGRRYCHSSASIQA